MAFLFHLLGCHGDLLNCKKRPSILALKFNSPDGVITGMIAYPRLSVHSVLLSVKQTKSMFLAMESYFQHLPSYRQTLTHETIPNGTQGTTRSLIPAIIGCPSNLHPHSPFQGIVQSVLLLTNHFDLNFVQIASVLTAWDFCAECSYYFLAATVFAIGHFTLDQSTGIGIGHNLLKLIRSIYKYEDKPECAHIWTQFNRYTNNYKTCFHVKSTFEHMVYLRIFLGQWCFVYHPSQPKKKTEQKSVYTAVLNIFTKPAKKMRILCGGHGLLLWSLFGYFPLWLRTYRTLPDRKNKNLGVIATKYNLDLDTPQQAESLITSISLGLSTIRQMPMDNTLVEHITCKFGRYLRKNSNSWCTWNLPRQPMYDAYDPVLMADLRTRNQIVVNSCTGTQTPLFRTCIIGEWLSGKGRTVPLTMEEIVRSTLVQQYIPVKNANADIFMALGDELNEGEENLELLTYLSSLYPDMTDFDFDPICKPLQAGASSQNYHFLSTQ